MDGDDCPQWKITQIQSIVNGCDMIANNYRTANCIKKKAKDELGEYWNVIIMKDELHDYNLWYVECYFKLRYYGKFKRYFALVRTH